MLKVWYSDTDPVPEIVAAHLDKNAILGVDKDLKARFLLPLMEMKAAAGFVNGSLAVDITRGVKDTEEQEKCAQRPISMIWPWLNSKT